MREGEGERQSVCWSEGGEKEGERGREREKGLHVSMFLRPINQSGITATSIDSSALSRFSPPQQRVQLSGAGVEQSTHDTLFEGSNPAPAGTGR